MTFVARMQGMVFRREPDVTTPVTQREAKSSVLQIAVEVGSYLGARLIIPARTLIVADVVRPRRPGRF
jgi:hypothetical protein